MEEIGKGVDCGCARVAERLKRVVVVMVVVVIGSLDANNGDDSKMKRLLRSCGDEDKDSCRSLWDTTAVVVGVGMTWNKAGVCGSGSNVESSVLLGIW